MRKYWRSLVIALKSDTVYAASVFTWRLRNVLRVLVVYALWSSLLFPDSHFGGYSRTFLLTYVLLTILVQAVVLSSRTIDVSSEISSGDLTNLLLKPVNFFKYYLFQDLGNKGMNFSFSVLEFFLFLYFFKPPFFVQVNLWVLIGFLITLLISTLLYFCLNLIFGFLAFYSPENVWAPRFLFFMFLEFLSGSLFPLDVLPAAFFRFLMLTPMPYLLYFPLAVYLGKIQGTSLWFYSLIATVWILILGKLVQVLWQKGLRAYEAWGR